MGIMQEAARRKIKRVGQWAFVRQCRNSGMSFTMCYYSVFGRLPTRY